MKNMTLSDDEFIVNQLFTLSRAPQSAYVAREWHALAFSEAGRVFHSRLKENLPSYRDAFTASFHTPTQPLVTSRLSRAIREWVA